MTLQEEAKPEAADMAVAMVVVLERSRRLLVVGVAERVTRELVARGDWRNLHGATDADAAAAEARAG
jgi:serine/threonine protein kinase HipA of HipAB toxin-antitoxin module